MNGKRWISALASGLLPLLWLLGVQWMAREPFSWTALALDLVFVLLVLFLARVTQPSPVDRIYWNFSHLGASVMILAGLTWVIYLLYPSTVGAWVALASLYLVLLELDDVLAAGRAAWQRWGVHLLITAIGGAAPVAVSEIESRFSDEEFFAALQVLALAGFWFALSMVWSRFWRRESSMASGIRVDHRWLMLASVLILLGGVLFTARSYQGSFFPAEAPVYAGISDEKPFQCGEGLQEAQTFEGRDVLQRLLGRVEANPHKRTPEYGMLTLATGEARWAAEFHSALLREAQQALFTGPANSVKSSQYDAALRVYYFSRARTALPGLFTTAEVADLRQWFFAINRRALTVEWVDWMYALAFSKPPEGPYENQENGAGLLALLETTGLAAPELSAQNRAYLTRNLRGWTVRFRNTDDALVYQPEWINNALFQSYYTGELNREHAQQSFDWLLLQALPDGAPMGYNFPQSASMAGIAYLGATLLQDGHYLWLAGKALTDLEARGEYVYAQPGVEQAVDLQGSSPAQGSCLLYGDSGLPNQAGPFAPDKIVFRDGWSADSKYLLLNLRFSGWHRYKGTNSIALVYQNGPLVTDALAAPSFDWLPVGRSVFRDKRIPRENLSGLLVEQTGMGAVVAALTGVRGSWAQDPPFYARVERFTTGVDVDTSTTVLDNWQGWEDRRTVYFYHQGPVVVIDDAKGPADQTAALVWQLAGANQASGNRVSLRVGGEPAEMLLVPAEDGDVQVESGKMTWATAKGQLEIATVFLTGDWVGAQANWTGASGERKLEIVKGDMRLVVPLHEGSPNSGGEGE